AAAATDAVDLGGRLEGHGPGDSGVVEDGAVEVLGVKRLGLSSGQSGSRGSNRNANAGIDANVEGAGFLSIGVSRRGDGDDDIGERGAVGKGVGRGERGRGRSGRTGVLDVGESAYFAGDAGIVARLGIGRLRIGGCGGRVRRGGEGAFEVGRDVGGAGDCR